MREPSTVLSRSGQLLVRLALACTLAVACDSLESPTAPEGDLLEDETRGEGDGSEAEPTQPSRADEIDRLIERLGDQDVRERLQALERSLRASRSEGESLEEENERLAREKAQADALAAERAAEIESLRQSLSTAEAQLDTTRAERDASAERLAATEKQRDELAGSRERLTAELAEARRTGADTHRQIATLEERQHTLEESLEAERAAAAAAREKSAADLAAAETELARARGRVGELEADVEQLTARQAGILEELATERSARAALQEERDRLASEEERLRTESGQLTSRLTGLLGDLTDARSALGALQEQRDVLTDNQERLEALLAEADAAREEAAAKLAAAESDLAKATAREEELAAQLTILEDRQAGILDDLANARALAAERQARRPDLQAQTTPVPSAVAPAARSAGQDPGAAVRAWARAWSEQRVDAYLSFYATTFEPASGDSRSEWERQRRERVLAPSDIEVTLEGLDVRPLGADRVLARFRQRYSSDTYSDEVDKRLTLVSEDSEWRIEREETVN